MPQINTARLRASIRNNIHCLGREVAAIYRPQADEYGQAAGTRTRIGTAGGYRYEKRPGGGTFTMALPGQIADEPEGKYYMALYASADATELCPACYEPPAVQPGDILAFTDGTEARVRSVRDVLGVYQTWRITS